MLVCRKRITGMLCNVAYEEEAKEVNFMNIPRRIMFIAKPAFT